MLSKEEIEKLLDCSNCKLKECIGCDITYTDRTKIKEYIKNLEADNYEQNNIINSYIESDKKLIEKLEERREKNNYRYGQAIDNDEFPEMYEYSGMVREDDYLLKILRGEKL